MLHSARSLEGFAVSASDGDLGKIEDVYVDDKRWTIRYFVVAAGSGPQGRRVLISPLSIDVIDWPNMKVRMKLSREQVATSPDIDLGKPVTREQEHALHRYYDYSPYWSGPELWGYSILAPVLESRSYGEHIINKVHGDAEKARAEQSHLYSGKSLIGYHLQATDQELGRVVNCLVDDGDWSIRFIVVGTGGWLDGKDLLISPRRFDHVDWNDKSFHVNADRGEVEASPEYDSLNPPKPGSQADLYRHGGSRRGA
jgi:hypothetical protein